MIRVIDNREIDRQQWDSLITASQCSEVYAYSWFLDIVAPEWKGIVVDDYRIVFPLPVKTKFGFHYLVQPIFSQQYGIYSQKEPSASEREEIKTIISQYKYIRISLSTSLFGGERVRQNFELALSKPYEKLYEQFAQNTKHNIRSAQIHAHSCFQQFENKVDVWKTYMQKVGDSLYNREEVEQLLRNEHSEMYVVTNEKSEVNAIAVFFKTNKKLYYLFPVSREEGKRTKAMFLLLDFVIQKYAGTNVIIDFEGSENPGISRFYKGFGAENKPYYYYERCVLPFLSKVIK